MGFWGNRIWHFHESKCGKTFKLDHVIGLDEPCPKCRKLFARPLYLAICRGCNTKYYNDVYHPIGYEHYCPINGEWVAIVDESKPSLPKPSPPPPKPSPPSDKASCEKAIIYIGLSILAIIGVIWLIGQICNAITAAVNSTVVAIDTTVTSIGAYLVITSTIIGKGLVIVVALIIIYVLLYFSTAKPANSFGEAYSKVRKRGLLDETPQGYQEYRNLQNIVDRSRDTIMKQQLIISILIIGFTIGHSICYLIIQKGEDPGLVLQQTIHLGTANVIVFAIIFFGAKFFFGLDKKLASKSKFVTGLVLSAIFGIATVITLIFLPRILRGFLVSETVVSIELANNIIADVCIILYGVVGKLYWEKFVTAKQKVLKGV